MTQFLRFKSTPKWSSQIEICRDNNSRIPFFVSRVLTTKSSFTVWLSCHISRLPKTSYFQVPFLILLTSRVSDGIYFPRCFFFVSRMCPTEFIFVCACFLLRRTQGICWIGSKLPILFLLPVTTSQHYRRWYWCYWFHYGRMHWKSSLFPLRKKWAKLTTWVATLFGGGIL